MRLTLAHTLRSVGDRLPLRSLADGHGAPLARVWEALHEIPETAQQLSTIPVSAPMATGSSAAQAFEFALNVACVLLALLPGLRFLLLTFCA